MNKVKVLLISTIVFLSIPVMAQQEVNKTALLIIDVQEFYFPGGDMELKNPDLAAENCAKLIESFRLAQNEIIYIQHSYKPGFDIHSSVEPMAGEKIFTKNKVNSFIDTGLGDYLIEKGIISLVICGMQTHMCVEAATRASADLGYSTTLVHDACTTRDLTFGDKKIGADEVHFSTLSTLKSYAKVVSTAEYLESVKTP
jgi:nicotinamidase-related amidase